MARHQPRFPETEPVAPAHAVAVRRCCLTLAEEAHDTGCDRDRSMCGTKSAYTTSARASSIARGMSRFAGEIQPYWCPVCDLWHVGHPGARDL